MKPYFSTCLVFLAGLLCAGEKQIKSGCPVGEGVNPFEVLDVTGPNKGKTLCYVCQNGARPVTLIFTREVNKELAGLVKAVDAVHKDQKKAGAFVVLLEKDEKAGREKLAKLAAETGASIPLTVNKLGEKSPDGYGLSPDVKNTILIYKERKVVSNFALNAISEKDIKAIADAAKKNIAG